MPTILGWNESRIFDAVSDLPDVSEHRPPVERGPVRLGGVRFEREMAVIGQFDHPNLIRARGPGVEANTSSWPWTCSTAAIWRHHSCRAGGSPFPTCEYLAGDENWPAGGRTIPRD